MKCKRCGKSIVCRGINLKAEWSDGTPVLMDVYKCTCGWQKGVFK